MKEDLNTASVATTTTKDAAKKYDLGSMLVMGTLCLTVGMGANMALDYALKDDTKPLSSYDVSKNAAADAMSYEQRASDVSVWTKDAINHIDPATEHRTKFVELAAYFADDGRIETHEYIMLQRGYDEIKGYKHTNDIAKQVSAMQDNEGLARKSTIVIDDVES